MVYNETIHLYKKDAMLTTKQKYLVASFGGVLVFQGLTLTSVAYSALAGDNKAKALLEIAKKHAEHLDEDDLKVLHNVGLSK